MYEEFFHLSAPPFRINPDPKYFFGSKSHNKAMAYLHYGLRQAEGFIVITGEIGAGKSMLIGHLLDQLERSNVVAAHLLTPNLKAEDLLSHLLSAFHIEPAGGGATAEIEAFEDFLYDQMNRGRRVLLIVDEAQNLPVETIEELRVLSNMDYDGTPLFQVFLVGQPDFRDVLARPDMEQLRQRVIASYHLSPLDPEETRDYIEHRLRVAGWDGDPSITDEAHRFIHLATGGTPRRINKLCNRLMLSCALDGRHQVNGGLVAHVVADLADEDLNGATSGLPTPSEPYVAAAEAARPTAIPAPQDDPRNAGSAKTASAPKLVTPEPATLAPMISEPVAPEATPAPVTAAPEPLPAPKAVFAPAPEASSSFMSEPGTQEAPMDQPPIKPETVKAAPESVLDRLRRSRATPQRAEPAAPTPATIADIATALAAAGAPSPQASVHRAPIEADAPRPSTPSLSLVAAAPDDHDEEPDAPPPFDAAGGGWGGTVMQSIVETREDLRRAKASVAQLRRRLVDLDRRRTESRREISERLERAEALLGELRDVWR